MTTAYQQDALDPVDDAPEEHRGTTRACIGHVSDKTEKERLKSAKIASLGFAPVTFGASSLVERVSAAIRPEMGLRAVAGATHRRDKGRGRLHDETSIILGCLIPSGCFQRWRRVPRGHRSHFWASSRELPIGARAFWRKVDAMIACGLVEEVKGKGYRNEWGGQAGHMTCLRATAKLMEMADACGCNTDDPYRDWSMTRPARSSAQSNRPVMVQSRRNRRDIVLEDENGEFVGMSSSPESADDITGRWQHHPVFTDAEAFMQRLNDRVSASTILGCSPPLLRMLCLNHPELHGRIYAVGADNYQNQIDAAARAYITIDGEAVSELDVSASWLSITLALLGEPPPDGDAYALHDTDGVPISRNAAKQWFVQFLSSGEAPRGWGRSASPEAQSVSVAIIRAAAFARYPTLKNAKAIVPSHLRDAFGKGGCGLLGHYLMGVEARIMRGAVARIMDAGGVALPIHDAVLVPASFERCAMDALCKAATAVIGRPLRVKTRGRP